MKVNTMAEMMAVGEMPDVLFWVGCAGSFDQRAQKSLRVGTRSDPERADGRRYWYYAAPVHGRTLVHGGCRLRTALQRALRRPDGFSRAHPAVRIRHQRSIAP